MSTWSCRTDALRQYSAKQWAVPVLGVSRKIGGGGRRDATGPGHGDALDLDVQVCTGLPAHGLEVPEMLPNHELQGLQIHLFGDPRHQRNHIDPLEPRGVVLSQLGELVADGAYTLGLELIGPLGARDRAVQPVAVAGEHLPMPRRLRHEEIAPRDTGGVHEDVRGVALDHPASDQRAAGRRRWDRARSQPIAVPVTNLSRHRAPDGAVPSESGSGNGAARPSCPTGPSRSGCARGAR